MGISRLSAVFRGVQGSPALRRARLTVDLLNQIPVDTPDLSAAIHEVVGPIGVTADFERWLYDRLRERAAAAAAAEVAAPRHSFRRSLLLQGVRQVAELLADLSKLESNNPGADRSYDPLVTTSAVDCFKLFSCCDVEARLGRALWSDWPEDLTVEARGGFGPRPPRNPIEDLAALLTLLTFALFSAKAAFRLFVIGAHPAFIGYVPPTWACVCGTERLAGPVVPRGPDSSLAELRHPGTARLTSRLGHRDSFVLSA